MILQPTMQLRWYRDSDIFNVTPVLQQKWIDAENGEVHWIDVPTEDER